MKLTHEKIEKLAQQYPNDYELGYAIRSLLWKNKKASEVKIDPNQISLLDSINEITKNN